MIQLRWFSCAHSGCLARTHVDLNITAIVPIPRQLARHGWQHVEPDAARAADH